MATDSRKKKSGSSRNNSRSTGQRTKNTGRARTASAASGRRAASSKNTVSYWNEIIVLIVFAISVLLFLSNFQLCGMAGEILKNITFGAFGIMGYLIPFILLIGTCFYIVNKDQPVIIVKLIEAFLLLTVICGIAQLFMISGADPDLSWKHMYQVSMQGKGGGVVGGLLVKLLYPLFGKIGGFIIHIVLLLIALVLLTDVSVIGLIGNQSRRMAKHASQDLERRRELREVREQEREAMRQMRLEEERDRSQRRLEQVRKEAEARQELARLGQDRTSGTKEETEIFSGTGRKRQVMNPVRDIFGKHGEAEDNRQQEEAINASYGKVKDTSSEGPAFSVTNGGKTYMISDDTVLIDDIIRKELDQELEAAEKASKEIPTFVADEFSRDALDHEPEFKPEPKPISKKPEPKEATATDTKTIITASGKVITMETGTGGEKRVTAEKQQEDRDDEDALFIEDKPDVKKKEYIFPPLDLLNRGQNLRMNRDQELRDNAMKLQQTLQSFGVGVTVTNVSCGPAVTRYELQPEQGVKVSKIVSLQDDIKLNLAAADIRIEAPIPGKAAIGIEIPNKESTPVMLRDLLESPEFVNHSSKMAFGAGKDIGGQIVVADVAKMPHLLIAGATGSGKSVCINTIIMSIIYKAKPSEVKMIMIDPKVVELSVYNGIPHLMIPVVTDPKKAAGALSWAVAEMTQRYKKFAELAVRDLKGYNEKVQEQYRGSEENRPAPLPQIVIIVDELADLMMVAPGDVEDSICRLAQMARAAGLHLIIATQRPSVNVITGVIKANVPSRIAFSVSSGVDSRTILDMIGAEKLLGRGDMLYYPAGLQKPMRVQGAFVSDKEVSSVVSFLTQQDNVIGGEMEVAEQLNSHMEEASGGEELSNGTAKQEDRNALDPLFREAGVLIVGKEKASIGMLQRAFRIGFNRAARIVDQLAEAGVVGEEEGTKPRRVLMNEAEFESYCDSHGII